MAIRRTLVFHHIPKSAGSYVMHSLERSVRCRSFGFDERANYPHNGNAIIAQFPKIGFFRSHWAFHPDFYRVEPGHFYLTFVRNPVDMFYSAWRYYREPGRPPHLFLPDDVGTDLRKMISFASLEDYVQSVPAGDLGDRFFPRNILKDLDFSRFDFIGDAGQMAASMDLLARVLNQRLFPLRRPVNETVKSAEFDREKIAELLAPELAVYRQWKLTSQHPAATEGKRLNLLDLGNTLVRRMDIAQDRCKKYSLQMLRSIF